MEIDEIKKMLASPDMDKLLAELYLKKGTWHVTSPRSDNVISHGGRPWMPSTNIKDALSLVPKITAKGHEVWMDAWKDGTFSAGVSLEDGHDTGSLQGDTVEAALCRALLVLPLVGGWP
jgi:hypothetical protein